MEPRRISNNHYEVTQDKFKADIIMNPRDAMVFANVEAINTEDDIPRFKALLEERFGAKLFLRVPASITLNSEAKDYLSVKFINPQNVKAAIETLKEKEKVAHIMANEDVICLHSSKEFKDKFEDLFAFKKENANFVTPNKIKDGIYSAIAEKEKITNSESSCHFAYYNKKENEFIGCIQVSLHHQLGYLSDIIVAKKYRNQGYAQALLLQALTHLKANFNNIDGAWLIEGQAENSDMIDAYRKLYNEIVKTEVMTADLQQKLNIRILFGPPKELLLTAANRRLTAPYDSLDGITAAKGLTTMGLLSNQAPSRAEEANETQVIASPTPTR